MRVKESVEGIRNISENEKDTIISIDGGKGILKIVANFIQKIVLSLNLYIKILKLGKLVVYLLLRE